MSDDRAAEMPETGETETVSELIERLQTADSIADPDMDRLHNRLVDCVRADGPIDELVASRLEELMRREETRRETVIRERHRRLLKKAMAGGLTEAERIEMNTASILLSDH